MGCLGSREAFSVPSYKFNLSKRWKKKVIDSFTGCETTSAMYEKGKRIAWEEWKPCSNVHVTDVFCDIAQTEPFH